MSATLNDGPEATSSRNRHSALHSSNSADWWSPAHIVTAATTVLGEIDLGPCSNLGTPNVPAARHYTIHDDGLSKPWSGRVYLNPPYGRVLRTWTDRLIDEFEAGDVTAAIVCVPSRTDTAWFRQFAPYHRCFVTGRLKFSGSANSAPFPTVIFYLGPNPDRFVEVFSPIGDCYGPTLTVSSRAPSDASRRSDGGVDHNLSHGDARRQNDAAA